MNFLNLTCVRDSYSLYDCLVGAAVTLLWWLREAIETAGELLIVLSVFVFLYNPGWWILRLLLFLLVVRLVAVWCVIGFERLLGVAVDGVSLTSLMATAKDPSFHSTTRHEALKKVGSLGCRAQAAAGVLKRMLAEETSRLLNNAALPAQPQSHDVFEINRDESSIVRPLAVYTACTLASLGTRSASRALHQALRRDDTAIAAARGLQRLGRKGRRSGKQLWQKYRQTQDVEYLRALISVGPTRGMATCKTHLQELCDEKVRLASTEQDSTFSWELKRWRDMLTEEQELQDSRQMSVLPPETVRQMGMVWFGTLSGTIIAWFTVLADLELAGKIIGVAVWLAVLAGHHLSLVRNPRSYHCRPEAALHKVRSHIIYLEAGTREWPRHIRAAQKLISLAHRNANPIEGARLVLAEAELNSAKRVAEHRNRHDSAKELETACAATIPSGWQGLPVKELEYLSLVAESGCLFQEMQTAPSNRDAQNAVRSFVEHFEPGGCWHAWLEDSKNWDDGRLVGNLGMIHYYLARHGERPDYHLLRALHYIQSSRAAFKNQPIGRAVAWLQEAGIYSLLATLGQTPRENVVLAEQCHRRALEELPGHSKAAGDSLLNLAIVLHKRVFVDPGDEEQSLNFVLEAEQFSLASIEVLPRGDDRANAFRTLANTRFLLLMGKPHKTTRNFPTDHSPVVLYEMARQESVSPHLKSLVNLDEAWLWLHQAQTVGTRIEELPSGDLKLMAKAIISERWQNGEIVCREQAITLQARNLSRAHDLLSEIDLPLLSPPQQQLVWLVRSEIYSLEKRPHAAYRALRRAMVLAEQHRGEFVVDDNRSAYFEAQSRHYSSIVEMCLAGAETASSPVARRTWQRRAWHWVHRLKGRTLSELLYHRDMEKSPAQLPRVPLRVGLEEGSDTGGTGLTSLKVPLPSRIVSALRQTLGERESARPLLIEFFQLTSREVVVFLYPLAGRKGVPLAGRKIDSLRILRLSLPTACEEIVAQQEQILQVIVERKPTSAAANPREAHAQLQKLADELGRWIWEPLSELLDDLEPTELLLAPHAHLTRLPLHAGTWRGHPLIAALPVSYVPAMATALQMAQHQKPAAGPVLIATDSSLPHVGEELRRMVPLFEKYAWDIHQTSDFAAIEASSRDAGILHFAAHSELDPDFYRSSICLGNKRLFVRPELDQLRLPRAALVYLNSCDSGRVLPGHTEELMALARVFLAAGSSRVMASLWKLDDAASALIGPTFYKAWLEGNSPALSIQKAVLAVREHSEFRNLFYWASTILIGC